MGLPHCPICIVLALTSGIVGVTRSYMFFIIFRELMRQESDFKFKFSFN